MKKTISIGADHGGFKLKAALAEALKAKGYTLLDKGAFGTESVDYPDYAHLVCVDVQEGRADIGLLVCTSGIGMSIAANKHKGVRAALCHNLDSAKFSRMHNNANAICMGSKYVSETDAIAMAEAFCETEFEGGRHVRRVEKMCAFESELQ